jgi:DNA-binding NtrC family response regulator
MNATGRSILHVDDDPQITRIVASQFDKHGYQVTQLHNPLDALDMIVRSQHRVVLIDIDMPGLNGLELLRQIKAFDGGIQAIMLTGVVSMSTVLESLRFGAEACFFKPLNDYQPLVDAVEATFVKIDRWWTALEELTRRRHEHTAAPSVGTPVTQNS